MPLEGCLSPKGLGSSQASPSRSEMFVLLLDNLSMLLKVMILSGQWRACRGKRSSLQLSFLVGLEIPGEPEPGLAASSADRPGSMRCF